MFTAVAHVAQMPTENGNASQNGSHIPSVNLSDTQAHSLSQHGRWALIFKPDISCQTPHLETLPNAQCKVNVCMCFRAILF